jgi:hypothetical protein
MGSPLPSLLVALTLLSGGAEGDERLLAAWAALPEPAREDVVLRFEAEAGWLDTYQTRLVAHALGLGDTDPGLLPEDEPAAWFDPELHGGRKPVRRRPLEQDEPRAVKARERLLARHAPRALASAWRYDWASGRVVRTAPLEDPERTLQNALAGLPPGLDLAEALVERALDDGSERTALAAFAHAYTDRDGHVYPGLTLYDAWSSGESIEMPDVDTLGVVHEVLDEWRRWKAPVPASKQDELYDQVGELFVRARDHRALRTALARTYLQARPALRDGYEHLPDRLHALWAEADSGLAALTPTLPPAEDVPDFLADAALRIEKDADRVAAGVRRREELERDAARVRALMLGILRDAGVED